MDNIRICRAAAEHQPQLHRLWQDVFGDPTELILAFFDCFPPEAAAWTVRDDSRILSAAYLIPGNWFMNGDFIRPAAYVYAVATPEKLRGRGYAGRLMNAAVQEARTRELLLYTRPADAALFPWYEKTMSARNKGRMCERIIQRDGAALPLSCRRITPEEYGVLREQHLRTLPHIVLSERFLRLQHSYCDGFYALGDSVCCCELQKDTVLIREYLGQTTDADITAQAVMDHFGAKRAVLRTEQPDGAELSVAYSGSELPEHTHWGLFLE